MFITANVKQVELKTYAGKVSLEHLTPGANYIVQISKKSDTINTEFGETFYFLQKNIQQKKNWSMTDFLILNI